MEALKRLHEISNKASNLPKNFYKLWKFSKSFLKIQKKKIMLMEKA